MKAIVWSKADVPYHRCGSNEAVSPGSVFSYLRRSTTHRSSTINRAGWWIPRNDFDFRPELQQGTLGCARKTLSNWSRLVIRTGCNIGEFRVEEGSYDRSGSFHGWYHRSFCRLLRAVPFTFRRCARVAFSWAERFAFGLKPVRNWYRSSVYRLVNARLSRAVVVPDSHPLVCRQSIDEPPKRHTARVAGRENRAYDRQSTIDDWERCFDIFSILVIFIHTVLPGN